jgi:CheY-like chemotaxis protein
VPAGHSYPTSFEKLAPPGSYVCLEVADSGRGMSEETKAKLFEPFFSTKFAGRGLGMAAVLGIVRGHHGAIEVHSRNGLGTEIEVLFPALPGAIAPAKQPQDTAAWRGSGTVLVVDDEESVRNVAKAILKRAGLQVITAAGGPQALKILRRDAGNGGDVGAVVLDLVMPQMDGNEVLEELRKFAPELPVILSSGYAPEREGGAELGTCGPTSFLAKPYRPAELLEQVCGVLARRRSEQQTAGGS